LSSPAFSVVIPAYNATETVGATIESVLGQTRDDFELIVVDDGSSDETPEIVRSFQTDPRVRLIEQANQGTAGARNTGAAEAGGDWVSFLDNDDLWMPAYLERIGEALESTPAAGFAYADGWLVDERSRRVHRRTALEILGAPAVQPATPQDFLRCLVDRTFIRSATTIRRDVFEQVGPFDVELSGVDDFDLWAKILAAGHTAVQAEGMLLVYRDRPDSLSKDALRMAEGRREVLRRIAQTEGVSAEVRSATAVQIAVAERTAAAVSGSSAGRAALLRVRLLLGRAYRALTARRRFLARPPAELVAAFGDPARL
jgi:glycosyltransferase involved in cell wall biosynthesis